MEFIELLLAIAKLKFGSERKGDGSTVTIDPALCFNVSDENVLMQFALIASCVTCTGFGCLHLDLLRLRVYGVGAACDRPVHHPAVVEAQHWPCSHAVEEQRGSSHAAPCAALAV